VKTFPISKQSGTIVQDIFDFLFFGINKDTSSDFLHQSEDGERNCMREVGILLENIPVLRFERIFDILLPVFF